MERNTVFASKSVLEHLGRGALGLAALLGSASVAQLHPVLALGLVGVGLVALRGCPMCWTVGLFETIAARVRGRPAECRCPDGRCVAQPPRGPV